MTAVYQSGLRVDPTQYKKSGFWDTPAGQKAATADPYGGYLNKVGSASTSALNTAMSGAGKWGTGYPDINDPQALGTMKKYGDMVMSEQRNATDQAVNRMANQGIRGGYGTAGGPSQRSQLASSAMSTLAGGAADRTRQALDYAKGLYASGYASWQDSVKLAESLLGLEKGAIDSSTQYNLGITGMQRDDYGSDVATQQNWALQAPQLVEQEAARQRAAQDRGKGQDQALAQDNMLRSITTDLNYNTGANANPWLLGNQAYLRYTGGLSPTKYGYA